MSDVENLHDRLRQELDRLGLTQADAARRMGEPDSQGIRDMCSGRKRVTAEFLAKLLAIQGDVLFVLTGQRAAASDAETLLLRGLQARGIFPDGEGGGRVSSAGLALLLDYVREVKDNRITKLTKKELQKVVNFIPKDSREWLIQPVALMPYPDGKASHILLVYRKRSPVSVVWKIGPFPGSVPSRIDITTGSELPLRSAGDEEDELLWQLDLSIDGADATLPNGLELRASLTPISSVKPQVEEDRSVRIHIGGDVGQAVSGDLVVNAPQTFHVGSSKKRK